MIMTGKKLCLQQVCLAILLTVSLCTNAQSNNPSATTKWIPSSLDLRLLEIRVKQYTFDDFIAAYQFEDIVLLPLGAISELIDIAIEVRPETASGFILKEDRTFYLDVKRSQVTLEGSLMAYDADKVHVLDNDIYVESNLLGEWLDMTFDVDLFAARIWISSEQPLPFQQRLERENRIARSMSRLRREPKQYPRHYEPYQGWGMPFIDQTLRMSRRKNRDGNIENNYQYTTYATADLLMMESALYFSGNDNDGSEDFRLTFGRKDPQGGLLGVLNAREFSFGHLAEPRLDLINQPATIEAGVSASNFPLGRQIEFDRHRFIGDLLTDWEVELYRNNALIGYQAEPINGQYDFQDVPLLFGNNHFRLVFYGPQGQIRVEEYNFDLNQSLTRAGEDYYRVTMTEAEEGEGRALLQYDTGLAKRLSASLNLASIPLQEPTGYVQHNYLNAGLRSYWDSFFINFDIIDDSQGGDAVQWSLQSRLGSTILGFSEIRLRDFFSEEFKPSEIELTSRRQLRLDTAIPPGVLPRIPVSFEFKRDIFADGGELSEISNQISTHARGIAISNQLVHQKFSGQQAISSGRFQLSSSFSGMRWRGNINYSIDPDNKIDGAIVTIDPGRYRDYRLTVGITHSLNPDLTALFFGANKTAGDYNLNLGARYNSDDEIVLEAGISVSLGQEPRSQQWYADARTSASSGSASALVFLDTNQDGIFNEGDEALEGIGFRLNEGYNSLRTDENGIAFLTGLPAHQQVNLSIAPETLVDPLWTVAQKGVSVVPRQGHTMMLDFPVLLSGEIDGTAYVEKDGSLFGVGRVIVELVDSNNRVVKTTTTAYDGFYVISSIPMGRYYLRISEQQLGELGLESDQSELFVINAEEIFLNGFDFVLRKISR